MNLEIRRNILGFRVTCPICEEKFYPEIGPCFWFANTTKLLCEDCIDRHGLRRSLEDARKAGRGSV